MLRFVAILLFVVSNSQNEVSGFPQTSLEADNDCCMCGPKITVTLKAVNNLVEPHFNASVNVTSHRRPLIYFLQEAVDIDDRFIFSATYFGKILGYHLDAINDVYPPDTIVESWVITNQNYLLIALSNYVPNDGDVLLFELYHR